MGIDRHISRKPHYAVGQRNSQPTQSVLQQAADGSLRANSLSALQSMADGSAPVQRLSDVAPMGHLAGNQVSRDRTHDTGLPDDLKAGIEDLSGMSMDHVRVHRNSAKPATVQAYAYAQGSDIHLGPGQEQHLPHEAWHVVQQAQGRVKPTLQLQGIALNDDPGLEKEADVMGGRAAQLRTGTSLSALGAGKNTQAAQLIGLHAYHSQPVAYDPTIQTMTMPAADYTHWGPMLQRRQIQHGAVRAGNQMVVTQFAKAPMQLFSMPSARKLTSILLIGEGLLTVAAGIGSMVLTSGIGILPGFMASLVGGLKISRGILLWPQKDTAGKEIDVDPASLKAIDAMRALEAILAITGGALAGNPKAIAFGAVKALRALLTAITDYMGEGSKHPPLRKGLMSLSSLLQFVEAVLVGSIGLDVIGSAAEATGTVAKGMTVAGGAMTAIVGGSKAARSGVQAAGAYNYPGKSQDDQQPDNQNGQVDGTPTVAPDSVHDDVEAPLDTASVTSDTASVTSDTDQPAVTVEDAEDAVSTIARDTAPRDLPGRVFGGMAAEIEQNINLRERNGSLPAPEADDLRHAFRAEVEAVIMHSIDVITRNPDLAEQVMHAGIADMIGIQSRYIK
ncbi:DUF4157 domain-containing protein [Yoonia sp. I 8.24]|uniref:eCIS core domain-containing protein n=1 Tax=Yoonia sp. I 8.24 TaxID=1537229 RepID=UPI001EE0124F|nr:DUF4157 domain-containing protein [Yoonia sp. I 8.24]MCG3268852.1 DUF4157 domain-containing protein [Yoonia sp. I 8.24]